MPIMTRLKAEIAIPTKEKKPAAPPNSLSLYVVLNPHTPIQMIKTLAKKTANFASDG